MIQQPFRHNPLSSRAQQHGAVSLVYGCWLTACILSFEATECDLESTVLVYYRMQQSSRAAIALGLPTAFVRLTYAMLY